MTKLGSLAKLSLVAALLSLPLWGVATVSARAADTPITLGDVGGEVSLSTTLVEKRPPASATAPAIWVLDYGAGRVEMPMFARTFQRFGTELADTPVGARLAVKAWVREFRGKVQLDPTEITVAASAQRPAGGAAQAGRVESIEGTVSNFARSSGDGPHLLTLQNGGGGVVVEISSEVAAAIPAETRGALVRNGSRVTARGELREGAGGKRLVLASAADLTLQAEAAPAAATTFPAGRDPGTVTRAQLREEVVLTGTVESIRPSRAANSPTRVTLRGPTGAITVVWWPELDAQFSGDKAPTFNQSWTVRGVVSEHAGDLQLRAAEVLR